MFGKNIYPNRLGQNNPAYVLYNIYPTMGYQITQVGSFLTTTKSWQFTCMVNFTADAYVWLLPKNERKLTFKVFKFTLTQFYIN